MKDVKDELREGDQVMVKVLALEGNRIKLSRKALKEQRAKLGLAEPEPAIGVTLPQPSHRKTTTPRTAGATRKSASHPPMPAPSPSKAATTSTTPMAIMKAERNQTSTAPTAHLPTQAVAAETAVPVVVARC